jgi:hypothetical protein
VKYKGYSVAYYNLTPYRTIGRGTTLNEITAQIQNILNAFLAILADLSADWAVLCLAGQGTGLRNRRFDRLVWSKMHSK